MAKRGGVRPGAGRPKKADEENRILTFRQGIAKAYGGEQEFVNDLAEKSKDDFRYAQLLIQYLYGKPKERIETDNVTKHEVNIPIVEWIDDKSDK